MLILVLFHFNSEVKIFDIEKIIIVSKLLENVIITSKMEIIGIMEPKVKFITKLKVINTELKVILIVLFMKIIFVGFSLHFHSNLLFLFLFIYFSIFVFHLNIIFSIFRQMSTIHKRIQLLYLIFIIISIYQIYYIINFRFFLLFVIILFHSNCSNFHLFYFQNHSSLF